MLFTLEALPASEGDCLLLHWGKKTSPKLAVIDGGPGQTYEKTLLKRLLQIRENRAVDQLDIAFAMVSHVDLDHITGVMKLFNVLKKEEEMQLPAGDRPLHVARLWHNTFNDILGDDADAYYQTLTASFQASVDGKPNPTIVEKVEASLKANDAEAPAETAYDIGLILAGHAEGRTLRDSQAFLRKANLTSRLNSPFLKDDMPTLISSSRTPAPQDVDGLEVQVVGPLDDDIEKLQADFDVFIKDKKLSAEAMLAAYKDASLPNLSSIVCVVGAGKRRILLTGDARGDKIIEGLARAKITDLHFDVVKAPHHGSEHNLAPDFFKTITADSYVFSANGRFGNPDRPAVEWLIEARGKAAKYNIVLTYPVGKLDERRKKVAKTKWKESRDSLAVLFKERKAAGFKFKVVDDNRLIELGDSKIEW
ncbi:MAG: hypothetical protein HY834_17915 [Devosia nanyangense]|uniref:MBL fold metallo-hydrolase n=1 Tax=Devosia nanyangense TaxID=1228055 RepID=A0A933L758_9HYPH|nr:hypothetical protein [Devosia nanyangense]